MLRSVQTNSDPWKDWPCRHPQCTTCQGEHPGTCRTRSVVYTNTCLVCKEEERRTCYNGETGQSLAERNREHQRDALATRGSVRTSHIREHTAMEHSDRMGEVLDLFRIDIIPISP